MTRRPQNSQNFREFYAAVRRLASVLSRCVGDDEVSLIPKFSPPPRTLLTCCFSRLLHSGRRKEKTSYRQPCIVPLTPAPRIISVISRKALQNDDSPNFNEYPTVSLALTRVLSVPSSSLNAEIFSGIYAAVRRQIEVSTSSKPV